MSAKSKEYGLEIKVTLLWWLCRVVAALPRWVRYGMLVPFVAFVFRSIIHYRRVVILRQLQASFPSYSEKQIEDICHRYYNHLAEMVIDTLSLAGLNDKKRAQSTEFVLPDDFHRSIEGRNAVVLTSHYGFWEVAYNLYLQTPQHIIAVAYRPLSSKIMDKLYLRLRRNHSVAVVASNQFMRYYVANRNGVDGKNIVVGLISDQNSPWHRGCCWHNFLNHDTLFFDGGEQLALKFKLPVYYLELERVKAGHYRHKYTLIYDGVEEVAPHEITERYARCLERTIVAKPEYWLWSHIRWKNRPSPEREEKFYNNYKSL